jgi:hypothetical protein
MPGQELEQIAATLYVLRGGEETSKTVSNVRGALDLRDQVLPTPLSKLV